MIRVVSLYSYQGNFFGSYLTRFAEKHLYFDQIVFNKQTLYQKIIITKASNFKDHRMFIDGSIQFSSKDEHRYHEYLVHPIMSLGKKTNNILILGGGDGLALRELIKYSDIKLIHLVDIDEEIINISKSFNVLRRLNKDSLNDKRVKIFNMDAFSFLNREGIKYDIIIIDLPDPHNEALSKLYSKEFYRLAKKRMTIDSALVTQSSSPFFTKKTFWCINKTLEEVFDQTIPYNVSLPSFGIWGFNIAHQNQEFINYNWNTNIETKAISSENFKKSLIFEKDIEKIASPINTIFKPILYRIYIDEINS